MYTDLPQFTRCCFCAPLRIGLLAFGYIKLILLLIQLIFAIVGLVDLTSRGQTVPPFLIAVMIDDAFDIVFSILLVVAAHKKHIKLFKIYYIYTIVYLVILAIGCVLNLIYLIALATVLFHPYVLNIVVMIFISMIALILIQGYIVLLVRSELFKLRDRSNIQFSNHVEEAQCSAYVEKI